MNFRRSALIFVLFLTACNLPLAPFNSTPVGSSSTPTPDATLTPLGTKENPIVVALPPRASGEAEESAQAMIAQLAESSALSFVTVTPVSYSDLIEDLGVGQVHVAWLPPFPYLLALEQGYADAAIAATVNGRDRIAAQFLVSTRLLGQDGFKTYFNPASGENFSEAATALAQFRDRIPCWTDAYSATGYVLPLGLLAESKVQTRPGAFLQGDATVVQALQLDPQGAICQFGATYADARSLLEADQPDVKDRVVIVWQTEAIVPYDAVVYASSLTEEVRVRLSAALLTMAQTERGRASLHGAYGCDGLIFADDAMYDELRRYLHLSGVDLSALVR